MNVLNRVQLTPAVTSNLTEYDARQLEYSLDRTVSGRIAAYTIMMLNDSDLNSEVVSDNLYVSDSLAAIKESISTQKQITDLMVHATQRLESVKTTYEFGITRFTTDLKSDYVTIRDAGQILEIGENKLYVLLRNNRWLTCCNKPYQAKINSGLLKLKIDTSKMVDHGLKNSTTVVITSKGLSRLYSLIA